MSAGQGKLVRELAKIGRPTMAERQETPVAALGHPDPMVRRWAAVLLTPTPGIPEAEV